MWLPRRMLSITNESHFEELIQGKAVVGEPVQWTRRVKATGNLTTVQIPSYAEKIKVNSIKEGQKAEFTTKHKKKEPLPGENQTIELNETADGFEITRVYFYYGICKPSKLSLYPRRNCLNHTEINEYELSDHAAQRYCRDEGSPWKKPCR